jgi:hypothetical protein
MTFKGVMKVGDLVRLREVEGDPSSQRMGTGLVVEVEYNPLDQPRRYPIIQVKFLKSEEILRFIERDLAIINEA